MGQVSTLPQSTSNRLLNLRATRTLAGTAEQLNAEGLTTAMGASWSANAVMKMQKRLDFGTQIAQTATFAGGA